MGKETIAEKYELELIPIRIGGKKLELYGIRNWDIFVNHLSEKGESYVKEFPYWVKIWEASILLADHLIRVGLEKQAEILEIGAGMGVTGLFLGAFGYRVTITDHERDALDLLQLNVERNRLHNVLVRSLDWNHPDLTGRYDVICGSEVIYNEPSIEPVMNLFQKYLKPRGSVFLAHDIQRDCVIKFIGRVAGKFEIENTIKSLNAEHEHHKAVIHLLRFKE